jgi:hypothetical protein
MAEQGRMSAYFVLSAPVGCIPLLPTGPWEVKLLRRAAPAGIGLRGFTLKGCKNSDLDEPRGIVPVVSNANFSRQGHRFAVACGSAFIPILDQVNSSDDVRDLAVSCHEHTGIASEQESVHFVQMNIRVEKR